MKKVTIFCGYIPKNKKVDIYYPEKNLCPLEMVTAAQKILDKNKNKTKKLITQSDHIINVFRSLNIIIQNSNALSYIICKMVKKLK